MKITTKITKAFAAAAAVITMATATVNLTASATQIRTDGVGGVYCTAYNSDIDLEEPNKITGSNWMSCLPDDKPLNEISIPGAHDASTAKVTGGMSYFAQTQDLYFDELLNSGVRYFDLRIYRENNELYMCHGSVNCKDRNKNDLKLQSVIGDMEDFLQKNPEETIILQVKCDRDDNNADGRTFKYFKDLADEGKVYCGDFNMTLGETRGKFVIFSRLDFGDNTCQDDYRFNEDGSGWNYWALDVHKFKMGDEKNYTMAKTADALGIEVWTEDAFKETKSSKWAYVNLSLTGNKSAAVRRDEAKAKDKAAWSIIYSSMSRQDFGNTICNILDRLSGGIFHFENGIVLPKEGSEYINPRLINLLKNNSDMFTGCLVCDYITADIASLIYTTNFNA